MLQFSPKSHPYSHYPKNEKKKDDDDDKSNSSKESKTSIEKLSKDINKSNNTFTTLQDNIAELKEEESNISDSDGESHAD